MEKGPRYDVLTTRAVRSAGKLVRAARPALASGRARPPLDDAAPRGRGDRGEPGEEARLPSLGAGRTSAASSALECFT